MNMKHAVLLTTIIALCITQHHNLTAGYESTKQEEIKEHAGEEHEADITTTAEMMENMENVDDAAATENQENVENLLPVNDASTTSAAEIGEQMGDNASQL